MEEGFFQKSVPAIVLFAGVTILASVGLVAVPPPKQNVHQKPTYYQQPQVAPVYTPPPARYTLPPAPLPTGEYQMFFGINNGYSIQQGKVVRSLDDPPDQFSLRLDTNQISGPYKVDNKTRYFRCSLSTTAFPFEQGQILRIAYRVPQNLPYLAAAGDLQLPCSLSKPTENVSPPGTYAYYFEWPAVYYVVAGVVVQTTGLSRENEFSIRYSDGSIGYFLPNGQTKFFHCGRQEAVLLSSSQTVKIAYPFPQQVPGAVDLRDGC